MMLNFTQWIDIDFQNFYRHAKQWYANSEGLSIQFFFAEKSEEQMFLPRNVT